MIVHKRTGHEFWYDRAYRCWFAAKVDKDGNLGPSVDAFTKREILALIDRGFCTAPTTGEPK